MERIGRRPGRQAGRHKVHLINVPFSDASQKRLLCFCESSLNSSSPPAQQCLEEASYAGRQSASLIRIAKLSENFRLGGIRKDYLAKSTEPQAPVHGEDHLADHFAGVRGDDRRAYNLVALLWRVDQGKPFGLAIEHGAVDLS